MGMIKNFLCGVLTKKDTPTGQLVGSNRALRTNIQKLISSLPSCLQWTPLWASVIFGMAAFNVTFPGLLAKWWSDLRKRLVHGSGMTALRVIVPAALVAFVWLPINAWVEDILAVTYPEALPLMPLYSLLISVGCFLLTLLFNGGFASQAIYDRVIGSTGSRRHRRGDPEYKRTRSGAIYGRWDANNNNKAAALAAANAAATPTV